MNLSSSLTITLISLLLAALYAGSETGFVSLDTRYLKYLAKNKGKHFASKLLEFTSTPEKFLIMTLIATNLFIVTASSVFTSILSNFQGSIKSIITSIFSIFIFIFCELLPKAIFSSNPLKTCSKLVGFYTISFKIFDLPIKFVSLASNSIIRLFKKSSVSELNSNISLEELSILIKLGVSSGIIREHFSKMANGIIKLKNITVGEVMKHRTELVAIEVNTPIEKAKEIFKNSGYSRIPVYENNIDQIVGVIYFKDLFLKANDNTSIKSILGKIELVPEMANAFELFKKMKKHKFQTAIVLDEYGSTVGLITLEDILEEVFGEIDDELDESEFDVKKLSDNSFLVKTDINLNKFLEKTGIELPNIDNIATLNGFIITYTGKIPKPGEFFTIKNTKFDIIQADARRTYLIKVSQLYDRNK